jgi:threonine dehydrogenase-like Zn-dependent dehydrogenase
VRATTFHAPGDIRLSDVPDPVLSAPTDAIVRVVAGAICGSDLWTYRGTKARTAGATIGHECVGVVEEVGGEVRDFRPGDWVIVPFVHCDNTCAHCRAGVHSACVNVASTRSGQGEYALVTQADGSLVKTHGVPAADLVPSLLTLTDGIGADTVLECVGTLEALTTARRAARPGATIGYVGAGHGVELPVRPMFEKNVGLVGGMAPVRRYLPDLLDLVLDGAIDPGRVFDLTLPLDQVAEGYRAMHERRAIKVLLQP